MQSFPERRRGDFKVRPVVTPEYEHRRDLEMDGIDDLGLIH